MTRPSRLVVAVVAAILAGCTEVLVPSGADPTRAEMFDQVWRDFDRYYASFGIKNVNWDSLNAKYRPQAVAATSDGALATVIGKLFVELHDPHVELAVPPRTFYTSVDYSSLTSYFSATTVFSRYVSGQKVSPSGNIRYGKVDADIGYVWVSSFGGTWWTSEIDAAMETFATSKAVIVDVRNNGGGNSTTAEEIAGRFASDKYRFAFFQYRNGPRHTDFAPLRPLDVTPMGPRRFTGPVILLTNRRVASASENFTLAMRVRPNTEVVGDTTQGGLGNPLMRALPNGWTYRVPQWIEYDVAMQVFEGIGIPPAVTVLHTAADSTAGRDPQMEAGIARARLRIP